MGRLKRGLWGAALIALSGVTLAADAPGDDLGEGDYALPSSTRGFETLDFAPMAPEPEPETYAGFIEAHNVWRRQVGAREIEGWSSQAAALAQAWADQLSEEGCLMRHNPAPERKKAFGENIYRHWRSSAYLGFRRDPQYVVNAWGAEIAWYDADSNECSPPDGATCGHYTQLVWSDSRLIGCGRAHCGTSEVWVCNYYPRGNYIGMRPYMLAAARPAPVAAAPLPAPTPAPAPATLPAASPAEVLPAAPAAEPAAVLAAVPEEPASEGILPDEAPVLETPPSGEPAPVDFFGEPPVAEQTAPPPAPVDFFGTPPGVEPAP